jgi:hypothetical protein
MTRVLVEVSGYRFQEVLKNNLVYHHERLPERAEGHSL